MERESPRNLHPLLVSHVRDEGTTKATLDAGLFPRGPHMSDRLLRTDRALEVRRILEQLAHESVQALQLFRSGCGYALTSRSKGLQLFKKRQGRRDTYIPSSGPPPPNPG